MLNEAGTIDSLLAAIDGQTRQPDEVVIVDGGSTDGTIESLERWAARLESVIVKTVPGANISAGRNAAIKEAAGPIIAATDAGCTPEPDWLDNLLKPFESEASPDVAMGFYRPDPHSLFERVVGCLNLPDAADIDPDKFMPSSRSVAFTKSVWELAGGYPEWLEIGEDMYFNFKVVEMGARREFVPGAIVRWRLRPTLSLTLRQYYRYAEGDGIAGMYPRRHALRLATYAGGLVFLGVGARKPSLLVIPAAFGVLRMVPAYKRAWSRLPANEAAVALMGLPALELLVDLAKIAGYTAGRRRKPGRFRTSSDTTAPRRCRR